MVFGQIRQELQIDFGFYKHLNNYGEYKMSKTISRQVELYVGREVDFNEEVNLTADFKTQEITITKWDVEGITQPSMTELDAFKTQAENQMNNDLVINKRVREYGTTAKQLENIIENGLDAEVARVAEIKAKHPKS